MNTMYACDMSVTYLRGGLSACPVVWLPLKYLFLDFIKCLVQLLENSLLKVSETTAHTFISRSRLRFRTSVLECASDALVCTLRFGL